jgi:hypothetical protein
VHADGIVVVLDVDQMLAGGSLARALLSPVTTHDEPRVSVCKLRRPLCVALRGARRSRTPCTSQLVSTLVIVVRLTNSCAQYADS